MAIIGISGKIGSGKDSIARIINTLVFLWRHRNAGGKDSQVFYKEGWTWEKVLADPSYDVFGGDWEVRKMADKLKDIVCLMLGCTRKQLEDQTFKDSLLPDEWQVYHLTDAKGRVTAIYFETEKKAKDYIMANRSSYFEKGYKKSERTVRWLLQYIGTELFRDRIHQNIHINMLFSEYISYKGSKITADFYIDKIGGKTIKKTFNTNDPEYLKVWRGKNLNTDIKEYEEYPNWIITDVRFPNEAEAILKRQGVLIRVNRKKYVEYNGEQVEALDVHPSETGLDDFGGFHHVIDNNGTIEELVEKVKDVLIIQKIIQ
jgi:hypothetical protein